MNSPRELIAAVTVSKAKVTQTDIAASNGVTNVAGTVLLTK